MAQQQGTNVKLVIDTEVTYKTSPTPDGMVLPFISESLGMNRALSSSKTIRSARNPQMPVRGRQDVTGSINFELSPQYGRLMKHIFGDYAVTGASAPYTHTYKVGSLPVGMVIEKQFTDLATAKYVVFNGLRVNQFKFSAKDTDFISCSVDLIGAKQTIGGTAYDATLTDLGHTPFDGMEVAITQGGVSLATGLSIDFTLSNNLDGNNYCIGGAGERASLPAGQAAVSGNLKAVFDSTTLLDLALANTETSLVIDLTKGAGTGASAGNEKLTFTFDEIKFSPKTPVVSGPTGLQVDLDFIGYFDNGASSSAIKAVLLSPTAAF